MTEKMDNKVEPFRSGFVTIVGRPNVGKSTLLNQLLGEKVAIVTPRPQTTRNQIRGIRTAPGSQVIFLDTPGIHRARSLINQRMVEVAKSTLRVVDLTLWLVDATKGLVGEDEDIARLLEESGKVTLVLLNKIDLVSKSKLLPVIDRISSLFPGREIVPISALKGENLRLLIDLILKSLPEGPRYYPGDEITDQTEQFIAAEMIREKIFLLTREEIPYGVAVVIEEFSEKPEKDLVVIKAAIHSERESHKPILIGKKGAMLKKIGSQARVELEGLLGCKVYLELFVKVDRGWTQDPNAMKEFGL